MKRQQETIELQLLERVMTYNFKHGRRNVLKNGYYHIYDGKVLLAKFRREIVQSIIDEEHRLVAN